MKRPLFVILTVTILVACGTTQTERTVSGGAMGAAVGAGIGALSGHAGEGAAIGGGVGAIGGALSPPPQGQVYPSPYRDPPPPDYNRSCPYRDSQGYCHDSLPYYRDN